MIQISLQQLSAVMHIESILLLYMYTIAKTYDTCVSRGEW